MAEHSRGLDELTEGRKGGKIKAQAGHRPLVGQKKDPVSLVVFQLVLVSSFKTMLMHFTF